MKDLETTSDVLQLFGEPSRLRLLSLLAGHELTVGELVAITGLTQSRVSTHLGKLRKGGLLSDRPVGASTFYRLSSRIPASTDRIWRLLSSELSDSLLSDDRERAEQAIAAREQGERWPDQVAGSMERHYSPGRTWEATCRAFGAMLELGDVLDVGSGDGALAELLAPQARSITCIDASERVVAAASERLSAHKHVRALCADMHELPVEASSIDQVLMLNVLTFSDRPSEALAEAARTLRQGGSLTVVTLAPHDHQEVAAAYGHQLAGIAPSTLESMLLEAGLSVDSCAITSRERTRPHFEVVTAVATLTGKKARARKPTSKKSREARKPAPRKVRKAGRSR
ncbi:MAG: metalloregulator ArsR/SmtB family transcription factor [Myxococcales bacterium]|nr:metalloregulator ArsR/SmtB family transcription factor [Myxococcales bacterium]